MSVTFWTIVSRSSVDATTRADLAELLGVVGVLAGRRQETRPLGDVARNLRGADDLAAARCGSATRSARSSAACRPCAAESSRSGRSSRRRGSWRGRRLLRPAARRESACGSTGRSPRLPCTRTCARRPRFHDVMMLFRSLVMIASSDDSTTAASRRLATAACARSLMSRAIFDAPITRPASS